MKQYKFTVEQKIKYTKIAEFQGLKIAILHVYGNNLIRNWQQKLFNNAMKILMSACRKSKSSRRLKKKYTISDLSKNNRGIYQEIMGKCSLKKGAELIL
ncbi:hypothetical protein [Mycoplasma sp. 'Moose RK']|uniref:hypothetical protein n=1 Tax=Mycoplasma sp. 'Moose RK' TaxID=2780095 RepID=UPI001E5E8AEB|nr:hypothetical protein [Mycoplasma sp. 'Moose RK']